MFPAELKCNFKKRYGIRSLFFGRFPKYGLQTIMQNRNSFGEGLPRLKDEHSEVRSGRHG
ncbi:MAG: hypothetical protein N2747_00465 [Chitinophagaceae bacterium]|nr:hypothetical protein [Chitinophagaceae bacterium]